MTAVLILGVLVCAAGVGLLHYFGTVADEQRAESARLEQWDRDLQELDAQLTSRERDVARERQQRSGTDRRLR